MESIHGEYSVFISPLESFEIEEPVEGYGWDAGIAENKIDATLSGSDIDGIESYVVVGWSIDSIEGKCWEDVYIQVGGVCYYPQKTERDDIVEAYDNSDILNCGFVFILPVEDVREQEYITLYGVDMSGKRLAKVNIEVIH